jgi:hypothetical protein
MPSRSNASGDQALWAVLGAITLGVALKMLVGKVDRGAAHALGPIMQLLISYSAFVWYCRDSDACRFPRTLWRNVCFNFLAILFVPWYLLRTRPRGQRLGALFKFGGFLLLMLVAAMIGLALGAAAAALF